MSREFARERLELDLLEFTECVELRMFMVSPRSGFSRLSRKHLYSSE